MKYNKFLFPALLLLTATSCKKVIEIKETDFIGGDVALQTVANNESAVIGAYAALDVETGILLNSTFADEVKVGEFYIAATTHEWQYGSADVGIRDNYVPTSSMYRVIDRANRALAALPKADSTRNGDNKLRSILRGEALFLRAFAHFELARFYAGPYTPNGLAMPYMETSTIANKARITMEPYFNKINADLAEAKGLVANNLTDIYRANKLAVTAFQARVALYKQDWTNAITYSTEYINAIPLASTTNFPGIWTDANTEEVAFKLKKTTAAGGRLGSLFRGISASTSQIGSVTWQPSDKLWNSYDQTNDVRFGSYFKDEPLLTAAGRKSRIIAKYAGTGYATSAENINDAKVFRTGEMYLIRAEAKAETGDLPGANADLNALRVARINGYAPEGYGTKELLITAIMKERFKELPYEGHRFFDLKRRGLPVERLASDAPTPGATTLPAGNFRFLLPIYITEIQANPLMQQNPGY